MTNEAATMRLLRAREAQRAWVALAPKSRTKHLRALRHALTARMDEAVALIANEVGKPEHDALTGDVMVSLEHLRFCEHNAEAFFQPKRLPKPAILYSGTRFEERREPHGVVLVFGPRNYPLQLSLIPATTALVAGNAVLLKCSEHAPRTAAFLRELFAESKIDSSLVSVSCESASEASALMDARPDFVFFTGSTHNGRAIAQQAAARLIPCLLELGGKDAAIVFSSAPLERTVEGLLYGAFSNAGRTCMGTRRILVEQSIYRPFMEKFLQRAQALTVEDIGELNVADLTRLREQIATNGGRIHECGLVTVLTDLPEDSAYLTEEQFGPIVSISPFESEAEALQLANRSDYALGASIWTSDQAQASRLANKVNAGVVSINDVIRNVGNPYAAFGGNKLSGYGRYRGAAGLDAFSRRRVMMSITRPRGRERHWLPVSNATANGLRGLLTVRHGGGSLFDRLKRVVSITTGEVKK